MPSWKLLCLATVLVLTACRTVYVYPPAPAQGWPERKAALQAQDHFELRGRVAIAVAGEGINAHLRWVQIATQAQVSLQGPLGTGGVQVTADGPKLSIVNSRGERLQDEAAREELTSRLGFEPPLASLRYWMLGVPDPAQPSQETLDARQQLLRLEQNGWQIDYTEYMPVKSQSLPAKVTLQSGDVRVRVVIDSWSPT